MSDDDFRRKKSKREPSGFAKPSLVNYNVTADRHVDDARFERIAQASAASAPVTSSTMDAVNRMAAGLEGKTLAAKLADPNRPTWDQYKTANADKLELTGVDEQKMKEYRDQLDKERDDFLAKGSNHEAKKKGKKEKKEKKSKKHKKHKKEKKHKRKRDDSDSNSSSDSSSTSHKKSKKSKKSKKETTDDDAYRLSSFFDKTNSDSEAS